MAQWRKVVVSGSSAELNQISASGNIVPISDAGSDLGSSVLEWNNLYIDGTANIDSLVADTADIDGGTVDAITSLTVANDVDVGNYKITSKALEASDLTAGRVTFAGTNGLLTDAGGLTFTGGNTLTTQFATINEIRGAASGRLIIFKDGDDSYIDVFESGGSTVKAKIHSNGTSYFNGGNVEFGAANAKVSGSSTSTGSFGRIDARDLVIDATHGGSGNSGLYVGAPKTTIGGHMELAGTGTQYFVMSREGSLSGGDGIGTIVWANDNDSVAGINVIADTADDDAKMTFWTQTTGPTYAERMVLDSTGNLGIGVTNPTNTLDVSGNISATSHITGSGNLEITGNISGSSTSTGSFGYLNVSGNGVFGGDITFGDANTDSVSFGADISSNLIPNADDTYDLGSATQAWQDLFLEGDITLSDAGAVQATAGNLQIDSLAATLVLDGHTGVDIDASNSGKVAIDGAGGIDIGVAADVAIDVDADTFDLDASGALTLDSTASVGLGTANSGVAISIGHTVSETTINDNLTITGDLTVNGDQTIISTTNLAVGDAFIFAATGSAGTNVDGGLIVQSGSAVDSGSAIYHDVNDERWAVAKGVKSTATSLTALQHVVTGDFSKTTSPDSTSGSYGVGEMWIDDSSDIWIRTG